MSGERGVSGVNRLSGVNLATALGAIRFSYGMVEATVPDVLSRRVAGRPLDRHERVAARVLGVRHILQAGATTVLASPTGYRLGAGVDALHALSMVGLAAVDRRRRPLALAETVTASAMALAGLYAASRAGQAFSFPASPAPRSPRP